MDEKKMVRVKKVTRKIIRKISFQIALVDIGWKTGSIIVISKVGKVFSRLIQMFLTLCSSSSSFTLSILLIACT